MVLREAAVPNSITRQPFNCTQREQVRKTTPAPGPEWSQSGRKPNIRLFLGGFACFKWFSSVQSLSCVRLFATSWTAARQASLSITNSRRSLRLTSIESVMPSSHLILCHPFLLLHPIPPSIRVFSGAIILPTLYGGFQVGLKWWISPKCVLWRYLGNYWVIPRFIIFYYSDNTLMNDVI